MGIPLLDTRPEVDSIWAELNEALQRVMKSGQFVMGPDVKELEKEIAAYMGAKHAVGCNSGTDALVMGIAALGVGAGDEVITSPFTFFATSEAITHAGAVPVFVDIDPYTYNLDVSQIERAITSRTKVIIPVHLYGHSVDMDPILELAAKCGIRVLEDVAQAFGSEYKGKKVSTIGDAGALSFFPSKNLGAFGDGGMLITNDDNIADTVRMLRVHGARKKYFNEVAGYNSRLDTLQAAILRVKLPHIDDWNRGRREAADRYNELLADVDGVETPVEADYTRHVYHQYTIRLTGSERDQVQGKLQDLQVGSMVYYPVPLHKLPVYADLSYKLPESEKAADQVISLPIWPTIDIDTQKQVVEAIKTAVSAC